MYPAIHSPTTPYITPVLGGVRVGTQVVIEGHVPLWWTERFDINLVVGHNASHDHCRRADIAFHFNPRFDEQDIVLNSKINGNWGSETRDGRAPCRKGYDFELQITVEEHSYRLTVNGQHFCNYDHRIPFREVGLLWIDGRVQIKKIEFKQLGGGESHHHGGHHDRAGYPQVPQVYPVGQAYPPVQAIPFAAPVYMATQPPTYPPYGGGGGHHHDSHHGHHGHHGGHGGHYWAVETSAHS